MTKGLSAPQAALAVCVGLGPLSPGLALAQTLSGGASFEPPLVRLVLGLILCSLLAIVAALALKRVLRGATPAKGAKLVRLLGVTPARIEVLESRRIGPQSDVCMLACDGREYLLVVSSAGATLLREQQQAKTIEPAP